MTERATSFEDDMKNIPLVDEDPSVVIAEDEKAEENQIKESKREESIESFSSSIANGVNDQDISPDEHEEKARLISQVLELQNTLDDLSQRVDTVKEENLRLKSENQVLGQYIENLMSASSVFQSTAPRTKSK